MWPGPLLWDAEAGSSCCQVKEGVRELSGSLGRVLTPLSSSGPNTVTLRAGFNMRIGGGDRSIQSTVGAMLRSTVFETPRL